MTTARASDAELATSKAGALRSDTAPRDSHLLPVAPGNNERTLLAAGADESQEASPQHVRPQQLPAMTRDAVRVHVEQGAEGLTVWIGLDAQSACAALVARRATSALLRSPELAARITGVVCNGTQTYASGRATLPSSPPRVHHHEEQA